MIRTRFLPVLLVLLLMAQALVALGQTDPLDNPKYGADRETRERCIKHSSFYRSFYDQKNYKGAAESWGIVYTICPQSSENIFIKGIRMVKESIRTCHNKAERKVLVDSLMRIYDKRMEYFPKHGRTLTKKGEDLYKVAPERKKEAYGILSQALAVCGDKMDSDAMLVLMLLTKDLYLEQELVADSVMGMYTRLSGIFAKQIEYKKEKEKLMQQAEALDNLFTSAGVATCENLVAIYSPKFEAAPTDVKLARTIYNQLKALRCSNEPLYLQVAKVVYDSVPTSELGIEIARIFVAKAENEMADEMYKSAISHELDDNMKAGYLLEYASFVGSTLSEKARGRQLAMEALRYSPGMGKAYYLIGTFYGDTRGCGTSKMDNLSVFWAAVDKLQMAKKLDPSLAADCDKLISYYSQYFPSTEEVFYQDLEVGKPYRVPCWINENTTIRAKK